MGSFLVMQAGPFTLKSDCEECGSSELQMELADMLASEHVRTLPGLRELALEHHPDYCDVCELLARHWSEVIG